jgi:ribosome modulation factor
MKDIEMIRRKSVKGYEDVQGKRKTIGAIQFWKVTPNWLIGMREFRLSRWTRNKRLSAFWMILTFSDRLGTNGRSRELCGQTIIATAINFLPKKLQSLDHPPSRILVPDSIYRVLSGNPDSLFIFYYNSRSVQLSTQENSRPTNLIVILVSRPPSSIEWTRSVSLVSP